MNYTFTTLSRDELYKKTSSRPTGLTQAEAIKLQAAYGFNELKQKQITWLTLILRQFKSPFVLMLVGAALFAAVIASYIDAITILCIVLFNTVLGFYQEFKVHRTLDLLKKYVQPHTMVIREGKEQLIPCRELVVGDCIVVDPGDYLPADVRFIEEHNLVINESLLSGESAPVSKTSEPLDQRAATIFEAHNSGFSGTVVVSGRGKGIVIATGMNTELGRIGALVLATPHETKFYLHNKQLSRYILIIVSITIILLLIAHLVFRAGAIDPFSTIMFVIALAVGITPEALPVVSTLSLAQGALLLAKHKVFVKRLSALEDLGSINVLCTDKTGTLTENKMTIKDVYGEREKVILYMALASSSEITQQNQPSHPFDEAAWHNLTSADFEQIRRCSIQYTIPFEPQNRRSLVLLATEKGFELIVRGAYEEIFKRATLTASEQKKISLWIAEQTKAARRIIAIAHKNLEKATTALFDEEHHLSLIGLVALEDPIKRTVFTAIGKAQQLGVEIKILTGDSPEIAGEVAHRIGLIKEREQVITPDIFNALSPDKKIICVQENAIFARVTPEQKHEIVTLLKGMGKYVGYLGDGMNDAPSLEAADVGIVVQSAADIARDASDIVLIQKSLNSILDGIRIGRKVVHNTINYLKITLASNFGNFYSIALISLFIDFLPMLPLQILLVNILSDMPMIAIATDNVDSAELAKPSTYDLKSITWFIFIFGIISSMFDGIFFKALYKVGQPPLLQTGWFIMSIATELFFIMSGRTKKFFLRARRPSTPLILLSFVALAATIAIPFTNLGIQVFHFAPPSKQTIITIVGLACSYLLVCEIVKYIYYHQNRNVKTTT